MFKINSLKTQLIISLSFLLFCVDLGVAMLSYHDALTEVEELFDAQLAQSARVLSGTLSDEITQWKSQTYSKKFPIIYNSWAPVGKEILDDNQQALTAGHRYESKIAFQLWSAEKKLWIHSISAPTEIFAPWQPGFHHIRHQGTLWRIFVLPLPNHQAWMITAENQAVRQELSEGIATHMILGHLFSLPIVILLIRLLVNRALKPLEALSLEIQHRHMDNLDPIALERSPQEIYPIIQALNILLDRLKLSWQQQKEFIADAAHELRTPLAALKVHAHNLMHTKTRMDAQESAQAINQAVDRCNKLVHQLLTLARQERNLKKSIDHLHLAAFFRETIAQHMPLALKKQQHIQLDVDEALYLNTHTESLKILLDNLLMNAIQYTPIKGNIFCCVTTKNQSIQISLEDDGPGIPEKEREKIFQRFYRINRSHETEGTGLGLSICQKITAQLNGTLTITTAIQTAGARFTLILPMT